MLRRINGSNPNDLWEILIFNNSRQLFILWHISVRHILCPLLGAYIEVIAIIHMRGIFSGVLLIPKAITTITKKIIKQQEINQICLSLDYSTTMNYQFGRNLLAAQSGFSHASLELAIYNFDRCQKSFPFVAFLTES